jgi:hypothetical protein
MTEENRTMGDGRNTFPQSDRSQDTEDGNKQNKDIREELGITGWPMNSAIKINY